MQKGVFRNSKFRADFRNWFHIRFAGDFDIALYHLCVLPNAFQPTSRRNPLFLIVLANRQFRYRQQAIRDMADRRAKSGKSIKFLGE